MAHRKPVCGLVMACAMALAVACGCDGGDAQSTALAEEAARWRKRYEDLVLTNETEIYPKLKQLDEIRDANSDLRGRISQLERRLRDAQEDMRRTEAGQLKERIAQQDEQIEGLLAQVRQLREQLAEARAAGGAQGAEAQLIIARAELARLGAEMLDLNLMDAALSVLERAVQIGDESAEVAFHLGYIHARQNRRSRAADWYERAATAARRSPRTPPRLAAKIYNNFGATLVDLGRIEDALAWYERAVEADPQYPTVHFNIGLFHDRYLNQPQQAVEAYRRHIVLGGDRGLAARSAILRLQQVIEERR